MSLLSSIVCSECSASFPPQELQTICAECASPLLCEYDLGTARGTLNRSSFAGRSRGMWRWSEMLPVGDPGARFSLGEGDTPLLMLPRVGKKLGLDRLYLKDEGSNPSGTFKARGMAAAISRAFELGVREVVLPTAGNAGGALAIYAARAGIHVNVFLPADAPAVHRREIEATGAEVHDVEGLLHDAGNQAADAGERHGWFNVATFKEPYRVEGKKIMGYELLEQFDWEYPDVIIYPTGGGTGLIGMWKAFDELEALGWAPEGGRPRMVSVQAEGCAPIVKALENGARRIESWKGAVTSAQGLRVPTVFADKLVLQVVRESSGIGIAVSEAEIFEAQEELANMEGIHACLEGAATLAGLHVMVEMGQVEKGERILLFNTGTGLKGS